MRIPFFIILISVTLNACSTSGMKDTQEAALNSRVGKVFEEVFKNYKLQIECTTRDGQSGCLVIDLRACRIWYTVDSETRRISAWRYDGRPENCWKNYGA